VKQSNSSITQLSNQQKDFCAKYKDRLNKYDVTLLTKTRRILEQRKETNQISLPDAEEARKKIRGEITYTFDHMTENQGNLKEEDFWAKNTKIEELEAIRRCMKYLKTDLPALLDKKNFSFPLDVLRGATEEANSPILGNMKRINHLREMEVTVLFSYIHECYKELPNIIKGGEEDERRSTKQ
jgi:hypothetical protein